MPAESLLLRVAQGLLACRFLIHGRMLIAPPDRVGEQPGMAYVRELRPSFVPWLTPGAAIGLMAVMASALGYRLARKEISNAVFNVVLLALSAWVTYGRLYLISS